MEVFMNASSHSLDLSETEALRAEVARLRELLAAMSTGTIDASWRYQGAGYLGAVLLLLSFVLQATRTLDQSPGYFLLNLVGAMGILASSIVTKNYPAAWLNGFWAAVAAVSLVQLFIS